MTWVILRQAMRPRKVAFALSFPAAADKMERPGWRVAAPTGPKP